MSTGKANFNDIQLKDNFFLTQELPVDLISNKEKIETNLNQILPRSENYSQKVTYDSIRPLDNVSLGLLQKILDIHIFLLINKELSTSLKLEYCNLERNLMKKYLKEIIKKSTSK